jgi:hypothetical protein
MMESTEYEGWTIRTFKAARGFEAVMTAPCGNVFRQPTICWQSHHSAQRYAKKFIDWYLKLEDQHRENNIPMSNLEIFSESRIEG